MARDVHAVTGAFGYCGLHLSRVLLARGARVRNLTGHPDRPDPLGGAAEVAPLRFDDPGALRAALRDVSVLYNTYWVRFAHGTTTHARAVEHSRRLFQVTITSACLRSTCASPRAQRSRWRYSPCHERGTVIQTIARGS